MQPDLILTLGDFQFSGSEIPERIPFGSEQNIVVHDLVGGVRVADSMGAMLAPIEWSGLLRGENAVLRGRYLERMCRDGKPVELMWSDFSYLVVVKSFSGDFERFYQVPYRISCLVVGDLSDPVTTLAAPSIDDLIDADMSSAFDLGDLIGDGPLSSALGTLNTAISAVSSFAKAAQSTINTVLVPLAAAKARVSVLVASASNTVANVSTLGGILPNNPVSTQAAKLSGQVAAMTQLPSLYNLNAVLGRMGGNLGTIGKGTNSITQAGGNLYDMAAKAYGDATAWTTLAKANNLSDPQLSGVNTVSIPVTPDGAGGVLNA